MPDMSSEMLSPVVYIEYDLNTGAEIHLFPFLSSAGHHREKASTYREDKENNVQRTKPQKNEGEQNKCSLRKKPNVKHLLIYSKSGNFLPVDL